MRRGPRVRGPVEIAVLLVAIGTAACTGGDRDTNADRDPETTAEVAIADREVALYFPGDDGRLHAEARTLPTESSPERNVRGLLDALLRGPQTDGLWRPLEPAPPIEPPPPADTPSNGAGDDPATGESADDTSDQAAPDAGPPPSGTVRLGPVYLLAGGTVVVDFETREPPAVGSREERLILFSLVNTVLLNTPQADRLVFLWNGRQPTTFAGHLDTGEALVPNRSLIGEPMS